MRYYVITLALFAIACKTSYPPDEPPITTIDADAQTLIDAGPDASPCALACSTFARQTPPCREARGNCVGVCQRSRDLGLVTDIAVGCLAAAQDRDAIHACGVFCP